ncbi:MAG TPA: hypothetical protein VF824_02960 [Thermoanaerobaculia bacterium]
MLMLFASACMHVAQRSPQEVAALCPLSLEVDEWDEGHIRGKHAPTIWLVNNLDHGFEVVRAAPNERASVALEPPPLIPVLSPWPLTDTKVPPGAWLALAWPRPEDTWVTPPGTYQYRMHYRSRAHWWSPDAVCVARSRSFTTFTDIIILQLNE